MRVILDDEAIDQLLTDGIESMTMVSLFTDRYSETGGRGFWADSPALSNSGRIGSRLYENERQKITNQVIAAIKDSCIEAIRWMESDGLIESSAVDIQRVGNERINITVNQKVIKVEL